MVNALGRRGGGNTTSIQIMFTAVVSFATILLLRICLLAQPSQAVTNTTLEGWQFDDNSRSTWTIVWTCFSTILACTWTVLRVDVPPRSWSASQRNAVKIFLWLLTVLCPEVIAWGTVVEMFAARSTAASCNSAQALVDEPKGEAQGQLVHSWSIPQGYCVKMGGLALQTQDHWLYTVTPRNILVFIRAGMITCSDFRDEDIQDRAKVDALGIVFTVLQSLWAMCNIVTRAAYSLSISPLELGTVAYVACGICLYGFWWNKPKDMATTINIALRYSRDDIPEEVQRIMDASPQGWVHLRGLPSESTPPPALKDSSGRFTFFFADGPARFPSAGEDSAIQLSHGRKALTAVFATFIAISFSGIHVAGWNFIFPTEAEKIAWRVFTLIAISSSFIPLVVAQGPLIAVWLAGKKLLPSCMRSLGDPNSPVTVLEIVLADGSLYLYFIARFGTFALMLSSLRALPADSYITPDWLSSIPHI
ncbi:hypothetical protein PEXP_095430 [Penicillium expansum]|nr:hypothetical protein PEXP_095430 [Penicillium expansum]